MKFTHIAFDIDGTLINSEYANMKSLQDTLLHFTGSAPTLEELSPVFGITVVDTLKKLDVPDPNGGVLAYWVERLHRYEDTILPYPGILELLAELKRRGVTLGVVSSQTRAEYDRGVAPMPLAAYFDLQVLKDDTVTHKPTPAPMEKFLEVAGCAAENALYVGDRVGDMKCARGAGVQFALARWGNPAADFPVDYDLASPDGLLTLL